jgi:hypothetical protein
MELDTYVDEIRRLVETAADAGGEEARAAAERLIAPLDAAVRLAVQHALADAAEEITCELAPGSVDLRVRGRELAFAVTLPAVDDAPPAEPVALDAPPEDDGGMARINVRMPESLKTRVEQAAGAQRVSVNAWLVRAAGAALERADVPRPGARRSARGTQQYRGWTR